MTEALELRFELPDHQAHQPARYVDGLAQLSREDILTCIAFGAEMSQERFVEVSANRLA